MATLNVTVNKPYVKSITVVWTGQGVEKTFTESGSMSVVWSTGSSATLAISVNTIDNSQAMSVASYTSTAGTLTKVSNFDFSLVMTKTGVVNITYIPNSDYWKTLPTGRYYVTDNSFPRENWMNVPGYTYFVFTSNGKEFQGITFGFADFQLSRITYYDENGDKIDVATLGANNKLVFIDEEYRYIVPALNYKNGSMIKNTLYQFLIDTSVFVKTSNVLIYLYSVTLERKNVVKVSRDSLATSKFYLTSVRGTLRDSTSVTNFAVTLQYPFTPDFNYVYIPSLKRFYYVTDIELIKAGLYSISLSVDVLGTYQKGILGLTAFVDRNENQNNPMIIDNKIPLMQGEKIETSVITNELFTIDYNKYPLLSDEGTYIVEGAGLGMKFD